MLTTPTKKQESPVLPPAPKKRSYGVMVSQQEDFIIRQKQEMQTLEATVVANHLYTPPTQCKMTALYSRFVETKANMFVFENEKKGRVVVKGPVTPHEFNITHALESLCLSMPTDYIKFVSDVPEGLSDSPQDEEMVVHYLGQPLLKHDLSNLQSSGKLLSKRLTNVILLFLGELAQFHQKGYVHGNISLKTIVYESAHPDGPLRLIDFANSYAIARLKLWNDVKFRPYGQLKYTDPVLLYHLKTGISFPTRYTEECPDIYAAGIVVYKLVFGVEPDRLAMFNCGAKDYITGRGLLPISDGVLELLVSLIDFKYDKVKSVQSSLDDFEKTLL